MTLGLVTGDHREEFNLDTYDLQWSLKMELGNKTEVTADLTIQEAPKCPCCGSTSYHVMATYDSNGVVIGKANSCLACRDNWCMKCTNGA